MKKALLIVLGVIVLLAVIGSLGGDPDSPTTTITTVAAVAGTDPPATTTTARATTTTARVTTTTRPTTTTAALPVIESGVYFVGSEIAPGLYRVAGYWARLDQEMEIIDNELFGDGHYTVTVEKAGMMAALDRPEIDCDLEEDWSEFVDVVDDKQEQCLDCAVGHVDVGSKAWLHREIALHVHFVGWPGRIEGDPYQFCAAFYRSIPSDYVAGRDDGVRVPFNDLLQDLSEVGLWEKGLVLVEVRQFFDDREVMTARVPAHVRLLRNDQSQCRATEFQPIKRRLAITPAPQGVLNKVRSLVKDWKIRVSTWFLNTGMRQQVPNEVIKGAADIVDCIPGDGAGMDDRWEIPDDNEFPLRPHIEAKRLGVRINAVHFRFQSIHVFLGAPELGVDSDQGLATVDGHG